MKIVKKEIKPLGFLSKENGKLTLIAADNFGASDYFFGLKPISELTSEGFLPVKEEIAVVESGEEIEEEYEEIKKTRSWITMFISFLAFLIASSSLEASTTTVTSAL